MMSPTDPTPRALLPLPDLAEATGVPAAAICRFTALHLLDPDGKIGNEEAFHRSAVTSVVLLRSMELLGYTPQDMRVHVTNREGGNAADPDLVGVLAGQLEAVAPGSHEARELLSQLRGH